MKKLTSLLLGLSVAASLAACGAAADPAAGTAGAPAVLRFWQAGADTANATNVMNELLAQFMAQNPGVVVEYQAYPWANDPHVAFQTAMMGGTVADLLVVGSPFDFVLAENNQILPLDAYIDPGVKEDLMGVFANECVYHGKNPGLKGQYISMPLFGDARTILFNKEIFDAAGVPYPETSWTHAEFIDAARRLTGQINGKQVYGFATSARYTSQFMNWIWNYGGNILNEDNTAPMTDQPEWRKGIEDYLVFYRENLTPPGSEGMALADQLALFLNGEAAMMIATSDYAREIQNSESFDAARKLGVGIMPHEAHQTAFAGSDVLVIPSMSQHPDQAGKLVNFLLQSANQLKYAQMVGFFPAVRSAAEAPYYRDDPTRSAFSNAVDHGRFYVKTAFSSGVTNILRANLQDLIAGGTDMDQYIANITNELTALIAEQ